MTVSFFSICFPKCTLINVVTNTKGLKSVGWERNVQGKLGPRMADLGPLMDPTR